MKDCILPLATKVIGMMLMTLVVLSSVFPTSTGFTDSMTLPKWLCSLASALLLVIAWSLFRFFRRDAPFLRADAFFIVVTLVCALESLLFLAQLLSIVPKSGMATAGSFDNVAGLASCLVLSVPLGISKIKTCHPIVKKLMIVAKVLCVTGVVCSGSRVGMLCLLAMAMIYLKVKKAWLLSALCVALLLMVIGFKHNSSTGRWFIYERSIEMMASKPLTGWGYKGFENNYMQVQADYFRMHGQSPYAQLADNVHHPLSEYLLIGVNYGVFVFLASLVATTMLINKLSKDARHPDSFVTIVALVLFGLFSYPMHYPFAWMVLAVVLLNVLKCQIHLPSLCWLVVSVISVILLFPFYSFCKMERYWATLAEKSRYGLYKKTLPGYQKLMNRKAYDPRFLYNYAAVSCEDGNLKLAQDIIFKCYRSFKDYEVCLLAANIHAESGNISDSERYYTEAHCMVPSRIMPLYGLYRLYQREGLQLKAMQVGKEIVRLKIKVPSLKAKEIKEKVLFDLNNKGIRHD